MNRPIDWTGAARRDLRRLGPQHAPRIIRSVEEFAATDHGDVVPIKGSPSPWRLRVGDWRVLFTYGDAGTLIILRVHPRDQAYR